MRAVVLYEYGGRERLKFESDVPLGITPPQLSVTVPAMEAIGPCPCNGQAPKLATQIVTCTLNSPR